MLHGQQLMEQRLIRDRIDGMMAERERDRLAREARDGHGTGSVLNTLWTWLLRARPQPRRAPRPAGTAGCCDADAASRRVTIDAPRS